MTNEKISDLEIKFFLCSVLKIERERKKKLYLYPPDIIFVQNFIQPDFQAKSFTLQKCVICDIFLAN